MPSDWNIFVSKIYKEEHDKDSSYQFKDAMKDASKRKSEMGLPAKPATAKPKSSSASVAVESEMPMYVKRRSRRKSRGKKSHHKKSRKMHKKSHRRRRGH